jgi:hypothetical protein
MKRLFSYCLIVTFILCVNMCLNAQKKEKKEKDPLDLLKDQWGQFDFHFGDNWEIERMSTFLLKSKEFVEDYYALIKDSVATDEELMQNDINLTQKYVIIEFNHEDLEKKVYDQDWKFDLEVRDNDKNSYEFKPVKVDTTRVLKGEEIITDFKGIQPVTVEKKRGNITQERITPTFWKAEKSNLWNRTYIVYFPAFYPDSDIPIYSDRTSLIRFDTDTKGIISMTAKWKVKDLPFEWNE